MSARKKLEDDLRRAQASTDDDLEPDEALAKALGALYKNDYMMVMSYLKSTEDVQKILFMKMHGRNRALKFLDIFADDKLKLLCSTDKGMRARLLVKAFESMNGAGGGDEKLGLTDRIKKAVRKDFVSP